MTVVVRPARTEELADVGALTLAAYVDGGFVAADGRYAAHLRDAGSRATGGELYVAEVDGRLAGTVTFCPQGSDFAELSGPGEGEFRMLAVASHARRRGVAAALVSACVERARELGYHAVVLCSMTVQVDAHRLYERVGFCRAEVLDWSPEEGVQLLGFRLPLTDPAPR